MSDQLYDSGAVGEAYSRAIRDDVTRQRVKTELREVAALLEAAEQIADGLVAVCEHAYDHDGRTKEALAAANAAAIAISRARQAAEKRAR